MFFRNLNKTFCQIRCHKNALFFFWLLPFKGCYSRSLFSIFLDSLQSFSLIKPPSNILLPHPEIYFVFPCFYILGPFPLSVKAGFLKQGPRPPLGITSKRLHKVALQKPSLVLQNPSVTILSIRQLNLNLLNESLVSTNQGRSTTSFYFFGKAPEIE